jgi:outer membrane lipoprotein LolB
LNLFGIPVAIILIAACARPPSTNQLNDLQTRAWTGRIGLQVASEPPQSFSGSFTLNGEPLRGDMTLFSPLGTVVGILRWSPGHAELDSGNGNVRQFDSVEDLTRSATGSVIPLEGLFAWLDGTPANVGGWTADLSRQADGRIIATRLQPAPQAELRVVLER